MKQNLVDFFGKNRTLYRAKAPARLDVMGGISDYSGSLVLQMPLALYTEVFIAKREDLSIRIQSGNRTCLFNTNDLLPSKGQIIEKQNWKKYHLEKWSLYVLGCVFVLLDHKDFDFQGLDIFIESEIPIGKGISSSAALEVATMCALYKTFDLELESRRISRFSANCREPCRRSTLRNYGPNFRSLRKRKFVIAYLMSTVPGWLPGCDSRGNFLLWFGYRSQTCRERISVFKGACRCIYGLEHYFTISGNKPKGN